MNYTGGKRYLIQKRRANALVRLVQKGLLFQPHNEHVPFGHYIMYLDDDKCLAAKVLKRTYFDPDTDDAVYESTIDYKYPFYIEMSGGIINIVLEKQKEVWV